MSELQLNITVSTKRTGSVLRSDRQAAKTVAMRGRDKEKRKNESAKTKERGGKEIQKKERGYDLAIEQTCMKLREGEWGCATFFSKKKRGVLLRRKKYEGFCRRETEGGVEGGANDTGWKTVGSLNSASGEKSVFFFFCQPVHPPLLTFLPPSFSLFCHSPPLPPLPGGCLEWPPPSPSQILSHPGPKDLLCAW